MTSRRRASLFSLSLILALSIPRATAAAPTPAGPAPTAAPGKAATAAKRIDWLDWGPEAFRRAQIRGRPILLNVVTSWSRQCRAMETTWADAALVDLVSDRFVPVRVDADRRPDVRDRYPTTEWPSISILLPDGTPLYAAVPGKAEPRRVFLGYLKPDRMRTILDEVATTLRSRSKSLRETVAAGLKNDAEKKLEPIALDPAAPRRVFESLRANFDSLNGGWTKSPKFPMSEPIDACLAWYSKDKEPQALDLAERAIGGVLGGAVWDKVGGGVHRLSVAEDWSRPEYEKLLDRNVAFLDNLLSAWLLTSKSEYADKALETIRFLEGTLRRPGGGFYASQSSDPSSQDGGAWFRAQEADRKKMAAPPVATLVLVGWSAKAAAAELRAAAYFDRPDLASSARQTIEWLLHSSYVKGQGVCHAIDGETRSVNLWLEDQVLFSEAMLDAYQMTGDDEYLQASLDVARTAAMNLRDPNSGLLGDRLPDRSDPPYARRTLHPHDVNSRMARVLAHLYYLNVDERILRDTAREILRSIGGVYDRMGPAAAGYALGLSEYLDPPIWVWVIGSPRIPGYRAMLSGACRIPALWKLVVTLDPASPLDAIKMTRIGLVSRRPPALYITSGTETAPPAMVVSDIPVSWKKLNDALAAKKAKSEEDGARGGASPSVGAPAGADPQHP